VSDPCAFSIETGTAQGVRMRPSVVTLCLLASALLVHGGDAVAARCLYVSSYHAGYEWNDAIERSMAPILEGRCELRRFYMDGKRHLEPAFAEEKAREAKALIDNWKPDVVITADDNAAKYLVMPHLRDVATPVVFCGLNWTAEPYGLPYSNATGMIEVGPIEPLVNEVRQVVKNARRAVFLSADEITQHKEYATARTVFGKQGITVTHKAVRTMAAWEKGYTTAQKDADFIILGNYAGIGDWNPARARKYAYHHARKFTVTYLDWMAPFSMLTMAKIADEQGEWAAKTAVLILDGVKPTSIPVVANRRWNMFINARLLDKAHFKLASDIVRKAIKVE
jgi:hypothetical protein